MATVYKIRNKDGLYSTGGSYPHFTKGGKTWNTKGALNNHINLLFETSHWRNFDTFEVYKDCELVEIEVSQSEIGTESLTTVINNRRVIRDKRIEDQKNKVSEWTKAHNEYLKAHPTPKF